MARKYDRYGHNRQYRLNPTRSRVFFPHMLPFQADFRVASKEKPPDANRLKSQFSQRARGQIKDAMQKKNPDVYRALRRKLGHAAEVIRRGYVKEAQRASRSFGKAVIQASFYGMFPEAAVPVGMAELGIDMVRHPKKYSQIIGGGTVASTVVGAYMIKKKIV